MVNYSDYYEFDISHGENVLAQLAESGLEYNPDEDNTDDPYRAIYQHAVYGGEVNPEKIQHFSVYEVDWPNEPKPTDEQIEALSTELDENFEGWILDKEGNEFFALESNSE